MPKCLIACYIVIKGQIVKELLLSRASYWYCYCCIKFFCVAFFLHPMANLFSACLLLSVFYIRLMRPNKVETGRGLLT